MSVYDNGSAWQPRMPTSPAAVEQRVDLHITTAIDARLMFKPFSSAFRV